MLVQLRNNQESIEVIIGSGEEKEIFSYRLEEEINLTNLILRISDFTEPCELSPVNFESFKETYPCEIEGLFKVIEYIYHILESFNCSYAEVYTENEEKTDV